MTFDLVYGRLNFTVRQHVHKNWICAIAHSNAFYKALFNELFHVLPHNMDRRRFYSVSFPVDGRLHPMYKIEINIVKLQAAKASF